MENHLPLRRHRALVSFSKDHHFGLLLVWKIRQGLKKAVDPERISNYVSFFFKEDLEKHFKEEEELLFTQLAPGDILRKQAEAEHLAIYMLVADIAKTKNDTILLTQLADTLEKHIRFEERELFNHLQSNIPASDLSLIEARLSNDNCSIDEKWKDNFWEARN